MLLSFNIHYQTTFGQQLYVSGAGRIFGNWNPQKAIPLEYYDYGFWTIEMDISDSLEVLEYKYFLKDEFGNITWEWGNNRFITLKGTVKSRIFANDAWRFPVKEDRVMFSSAFTKVILKPDSNIPSNKSTARKQLQFSIQAPRVGKGYQVCVLGNQTGLGNWDQKKPLLLGCNNHYPLWTGTINAGSIKFPVNYKYGIYDTRKKVVTTIEEGYNREIYSFPDSKEEFLYIQSDEGFRYPVGNWKGAGVAIPVFSLRSEKSFGVGEFMDLIDLVDWSKEVGLKLIQILPINETIASHNWLDSYPYKAISVMALHPIYLNLTKMGTLTDTKKNAEFKALQKELNKEPYVNYPKVLAYKSKYFKLLFDQEKDTFFNTKEYQTFLEYNKDWLIPYAAFVFLRDKMKSPDFRKWKEYKIYNQEKIEKLCSSDSKEWNDIAIHFFIQFHLDKQLQEVAAYARSQGIVLKGDIPIGISPNSVEAWIDPRLFNLNAQAGAPPDAFAVKGQNWGFPTYDWDAMAKEKYRWWTRRLQKMADYFDAYRIDHVLGFFRIWEIPLDAVEGILGYFNPALPMSADEIRGYGIPFDYDRMVKPYIREHILQQVFGKYRDEVIKTYLKKLDDNTYELKEKYNTQKKINASISKGRDDEELSDKERHIRDGLFSLVANVLFINTGHDQWHPRISMHYTTSYDGLDDFTKERLNDLYIQYYYKRHEEFWYQKGLEKLPAIVDATDMLVCGEDLGMVPDCVPSVMEQLNILSLEIQRMPKNPKVKFGHPNDAPYLSVCTTSTHDMSTIRGWWEENREVIQEFYNHELGNMGEAPFFAEPWICQQIITQHIYSPAMWTIFPIQDLLAMDGDLRWEQTHLERINLPSNIRHKWQFRMHQSIEELKNAKNFNALLKKLLFDSGRNSDY